MAEIKIEKKKPIWPWVLVALIVLALIWFFSLDDSDNRAEIEADNSEVTQLVIEDESRTIAAEAIATYSAYIADSGKMGIDHVYSSGALNYLIDAVEATGNMLEVDIKADLEEARANANEIKEEPYDINHADLIKKSGISILRALTTMQEAKFPDLAQEVVNIDEALSAIDKVELTLDQKDDVKNFFNSAESLLVKMQ
jgi:hypothetical protein